MLQDIDRILNTVESQCENYDHAAEKNWIYFDGCNDIFVMVGTGDYNCNSLRQGFILISHNDSIVMYYTRCTVYL